MKKPRALWIGLLALCVMAPAIGHAANSYYIRKRDPDAAQGTEDASPAVKSPIRPYVAKPENNNAQQQLQGPVVAPPVVAIPFGPCTEEEQKFLANFTAKVRAVGAEAGGGQSTFSQKSKSELQELQKFHDDPNMMLKVIDMNMRCAAHAAMAAQQKAGKSK